MWALLLACDDADAPRYRGEPELSETEEDGSSWTGGEDCLRLRSFSTLSGRGNEGLGGVAWGLDGSRTLSATFTDELVLQPGGRRETVLEAAAGGSAYLRDAFVARWGPAGWLDWVLPLQGRGNHSVGRPVLTAQGDLVVPLYYEGPSTLGALSLQGRHEDSLLARLSPRGELMWTRTLSGPGVDYWLEILPLPDGDLLVSGVTSGDLELEPGSRLELPEGAEKLGFVARLAGDGQLRWVQRVGGDASVHVSGLAYDAAEDEWVAVGHEYDESSSELPDVSVFVARYTGEGELRWQTHVTGSLVSARQVVSLPGGEVAVSGEFHREATFGKGEPNEVSLTSVTEDAWLARFDAEGRLAWVKHTAAVRGLADTSEVALGADGSLLWASRVIGAATLGGVDFGAQPDSASALLVQVDPEGALRCALELWTSSPETYAGVTFSQVLALPDGGWELGGTSLGAVHLGEERLADSQDSDLLWITVDPG